MKEINRLTISKRIAKVPLITFSVDYISFNEHAIRYLAIKNESRFVLYLDNSGSIFYEDTAHEKGFKIRLYSAKGKSGNYSYCHASAVGIRNHLGIKDTKRFVIGPINEGKRKLTPYSNGKKVQAKVQPQEG